MLANTFVFNIILFFPKHETSLLVKLVLLFITLALEAFTYYAFIMSECDLLSVLLS